MAGPVRVSDLVRLGGGREAEVFAWDDGRALRLAHAPGYEAVIELEATAMSAARRAGAPAPAVHEKVQVDGRPGVVVERVDGEDLLTRLGRRPWSVRSVGRLLGRLHARIHGVTAPKEFRPVREMLTARLRSELVPTSVGERAIRSLDELPDGEALCHGDFHPANVLAGRGGHYVIDWTGAARGDPAADVARTCVILVFGGVPAEAPPAVRRMQEAGRRMLLRAYLRAYRRERRLDLRLVERWLPASIATRLAEGIDDERETLLEASGTEPTVALPGSRPLPAPNRRWLLRFALGVTALVNLVLGGGIAWLSALGEDEIPRWSAQVGETNVIADTVGTFFILPLVTCLMVTTAVWRELADGRLERLGPGEDRVPLLRLLPAGRLSRGLGLGALCAAALGPPAVILLVLLDAGPLAVGEFVGYKALLGVVFGAVVTPVIALCAMADPR